MCEKDEIDIRWGIENDIDYIAASFVRKASDVTEIRNYTKKLLIEKYGPTALEVKQLPRIISKIESTEALANFDSILEESDAIMVSKTISCVIARKHTCNLFHKHQCASAQC